ncbi:hypothetical protein JL720_9169 [Aureococcus anophagefferens]|nr:hypothetical protein JL720_9169 [Aureococcus anophagefferens]
MDGLDGVSAFEDASVQNAVRDLAAAEAFFDDDAAAFDDDARPSSSTSGPPSACWATPSSPRARGARGLPLRAATASRLASGRRRAVLQRGPRASVVFFGEVIGPAKRALATYPVFLFYAFLSFMILIN